MKKLVLVTVFIVPGIMVFAGGAGEGDMVEESFSFSGIDKLTVEGAFFEVQIIGSSTTMIEADEGLIVLGSPQELFDGEVFLSPPSTKTHRYSRQPYRNENLHPLPDTL